MNRDEFTALVDKAVAALKAAGAREVYLFGSAAKGTLREALRPFWLLAFCTGKWVRVCAGLIK